MPKIEILKNTACNSKAVSVGEICEVSDAIAIQLIKGRKAKIHVAVQVAQKQAAPKVAKAKASKRKSSAKAKSNTLKKDI